jgi:hypothetical protein
MTLTRQGASRLTLLVNAILPSENPEPFSVKYYKKYGFV